MVYSGEPTGPATCKPHSLVGREVCEGHQDWTCCSGYEWRALFLRRSQSSTEGVGPHGVAGSDLGVRNGQSAVPTASRPSLTPGILFGEVASGRKPQQAEQSQERFGLRQFVHELIN